MYYFRRYADLNCSEVYIKTYLRISKLERAEFGAVPLETLYSICLLLWFITQRVQHDIRTVGLHKHTHTHTHTQRDKEIKAIPQLHYLPNNTFQYKFHCNVLTLHYLVVCGISHIKLQGVPPKELSHYQIIKNRIKACQ